MFVKERNEEGRERRTDRGTAALARLFCSSASGEWSPIFTHKSDTNIATAFGGGLGTSRRGAPKSSFQKPRPFSAQTL